MFLYFGKPYWAYHTKTMYNHTGHGLRIARIISTGRPKLSIKIGAPTDRFSDDDVFKWSPHPELIHNLDHKLPLFFDPVRNPEKRTGTSFSYGLKFVRIPLRIRSTERSCLIHKFQTPTDSNPQGSRQVCYRILVF